jgi:hypothetical protein
LYNVSDTPRRESRFSWTEEEASDIDRHIISDGLEDTPYYSGRVATLMRSVTESIDDDEEEEEEEIILSSL